MLWTPVNAALVHCDLPIIHLFWILIRCVGWNWKPLYKITWTQASLKLHCMHLNVLFLLDLFPRGATWMARGGIRLVHGHTKSTLITYFSGMKIDPNYAFLHAFFLIFLSYPFQNLSIWPKTHPFFQFCTFLHP